MTTPPMNQPDPRSPADPAVPAHSLADIHAANPQKSRTGLTRVWHAAGYSMQGLRAGWGEKAFRMEAILALLMLPASLWLAHDWRDWALLITPVFLVLIAELLNTGIEMAMDRFGPQWHDLAKKAKDMGSAAVFLALVLCAAVWLPALYERLLK
ncbi:diacylglycerol kinase [Comamonas sp. JUb58]|uniref:diacylglycerol kinase n=1 Tax=Comamonas sp. JUb58 TaxID=2485114 RepID=UPI0010ED45E8|nr:diacylglycerol kinase [Comamonas sp. JUb58]TDS72994.1 diacylglycerol kinase (ATP) [Comamonas sp. JUb58]